jgi:ketosteroid isomerase-like protein
VSESEIRTLVDGRSEAIRAKDLDRLMSYYAADIIYFDVVPPLQYVGSDALRDRFRHWLDGYQSGIGQDVSHLNIVAGGDIAFASMLVRTGGTLKNGQQLDAWARATSCCKRSGGTWLVTHEHISVPIDPVSMRPVMGLTP